MVSPLGGHEALPPPVNTAAPVLPNLTAAQAAPAGGSAFSATAPVDGALSGSRPGSAKSLQSLFDPDPAQDNAQRAALTRLLGSYGIPVLNTDPTDGLRQLQRQLPVRESGRFDTATYARIMTSGTQSQQQAATGLAMLQPWWNADMHNGGISPSLVNQLSDSLDRPAPRLPVRLDEHKAPALFDPSRYEHMFRAE